MSSNHRDGPDYNESPMFTQADRREVIRVSGGCVHERTKIWEPHMAGARKCVDCHMVYNPNRSPSWQIEPPSVETQVATLQKEVQRLAAENEAYMSTDYWFERHKDVKAQLDDAQEWLVAKDDQIEHLVDFGDRMEEQRDALILAMVRIANKPDEAKSIAEKTLAAQVKAQKK